jgi:predicted short-subunit dehydrogenase-like oxidoreductase (DUF2520 family)
MKKPEKKFKHRPSSSNRRRSKNFRVSIIGAGRMGSTLGQALKQLGYSIELVVTRHAASARHAAKLLKAEGIDLTQLGLSGESGRERLLGTNFLLLSTPDDVLETVASQLATTFEAQTRNGKRPRGIALHTSGALSSEVLEPLRNAGFAVASLHPLISIADAKSNRKTFRGAFFCVEGDPAAVRVARAIVRELGGNSFTIDAKSKALYHAAAVMSSGHVVAIFDLAVEMLKYCGLRERRARQVLLPLLESTTANLASKDPARALTGPFARGDSATAKKHVAALKAAGADAALDAYVVLGSHSLNLARNLPRDSGAFDQISRLLSQSRKRK